MMANKKIGIFIFTRDLRLEDNLALISVLKSCDKVIPVFIFNPVQIGDENKYKSDNCVQFMIECLEELDTDLRKKGSRMFYFHGNIKNVLTKIIKNTDIHMIGISKDYTPFAQKREKEIDELCKENEIIFDVTENHMITGVETVEKASGGFYTKYTPYLMAAKKISVPKPVPNKYNNYISKTYKYPFEYTDDIHDFYDSNNNVFVHGGRSNALKILKKISNFKNYKSSREIPSKDGTTKLSAYLKFNVVSMREVYWKCVDKLSCDNQLINELYWRDFYMQFIYHNGMDLYDNVKWNNNPKLINAWKEGKTGIPFVDAGIRQMLKTGWMHNRVRMCVASVLVKTFHCDWKIGEKFFAYHLIDYDPHSNTGNWMWISSVSGADSQPYFRSFNPWRQAEKYDSNAEYIKQYVDELNNVPAKDIMKWNEKYDNWKNINYPKPIVKDIAAESKKSTELFKKALDKKQTKH